MLDEIVRHQIWLQQYGNGLTKEVTKDLKALRDRINARILNAPPYELERLSIILKEVNLLIVQGMGKVQPSLWNELAEYENEFALKTLDDSTPASVTIGTGLNTAALTAITAESIVTLQGEEPMTIREMIKKLSSRYAKDIESEIRLGIADGSTNAQIVERLTGLANTRTKNQIESVILTVTNHVGNTVRDQVFGKYDKLFKGKRYLTVLDNRVSDICMSRSGRLYPLDTDVTLPAHFRCLSGDTNISTSYPISYISRRAYKGVMYTITTSSGNKIVCTPNHPILTNRGFVAADSINSADKIATDIGCERIRFIDNQNDKGVATIEDIFTSLWESSGVKSVKMPTSTKDFHGDVTNDEVDVVFIDRELFFKRYPSRSEVISDYFLVGASFSTPGISTSYKNFFTHWLASIGIMSRLNLISSLILRHKLPFHNLLLGLVSNLNSLSNKFGFKKIDINIKPICYPSNSDSMFIEGYSIFESESTIKPMVMLNDSPASGLDSLYDGHSADSHIFRNFTSGFQSDKVFFDDIVDISIAQDVSTHVYNLENDLGYYTANNLITHNCRSTWRFELKDEYSLGDEGDTQASVTYDKYGNKIGGKQVPISMTYSDWLKRQPEAVIDEVLGKERSKLFRDGKLELSQFVNNRGRMLTLEELKKLDLIK